MTEIKEGARYRVTFEGVGKAHGVTIGGHNLYPTTLEEATSVEVIEPEYEPGQWYISDGGVVYLRTADSWLVGVTGIERDNDAPVRPLRKLVPEDDK